MKDNIESKHIGNRKFIIELRYDHKVIIADKRGAIIEEIKALNLFHSFQWEMGLANVIIWEGTKKEDARNTISIDLNRLSFTCSKIDSVDSFYNIFTKIYDCIISKIGELDIRRIGCRIQGTYRTNSSNFKTVIEKLEQNFPVQFYLEDFPATDLLFQLNYKNGMYNVGPVKDKGDVFVEQNFAESYRVNHVGFAIDTDNYLTNEFGPINDKKLIKETYTLSLSVEKKLFDNLIRL